MQSLADMTIDQRLQPRSTLAERQAAQILAVLGQQVIGDHRRRKGLHRLGVHRLAIKPLLQVPERRDRPVAPDDQLAIDRAFERQGFHHVGKGGRNLVAGAGIELADLAL